MASGYEKHPDYGGSEPSWLEIILLIILLISIGAIVITLGLI